MKKILITLALMFPFIFVATMVVASDSAEKKIIPVTNNIGFLKHSPKALQKKFPMCDDFLMVTWIDKEKIIGYSHYDFYVGSRKSKKVAFALVHLDKDHPRLDYDLEQYHKQGKLREVFSFIRRGEVSFPEYSLFIEGRNRPGYLQGNFDPRLGDFPKIELESLAMNQENVCVPYPDNQRMWIAEGRFLAKIEVVDDCGVSRPGLDYFTTDGEYVYLNNQCKLVDSEPKSIIEGK